MLTMTLLRYDNDRNYPSLGCVHMYREELRSVRQGTGIEKRNVCIFKAIELR